MGLAPTGVSRAGGLGSCRHKGSGRRRSSPSGACARRTAPGRRDRLPDLYEPHVPRRPKTVQDAQLCARCSSAMAMAMLSAGASAREASSLRLSSTSSPGSLRSSSSPLTEALEAAAELWRGTVQVLDENRFETAVTKQLASRRHQFGARGAHQQRADQTILGRWSSLCEASSSIWECHRTVRPHYCILAALLHPTGEHIRRALTCSAKKALQGTLIVVSSVDLGCCPLILS